MTIDDQLRRERLSRKLIRGVILTAASLQIMIVSVGKKWDLDYTISLTFTAVMMVAGSGSVDPLPTYAIYVMHGSLRYVTQDEAESLIFWREKIGPLIGIPFVAAFLILTVFRKERPERI